MQAINKHKAMAWDMFPDELLIIIIIIIIIIMQILIRKQSINRLDFTYYRIIIII